MGDYDIIVKNVLIIDGSGAKGFKGSIAVKGERIISVGDELEGDADIVIDGGGLVAAPGFIDIHSHVDETILLNPNAWSTVVQGITTVIGGNCGFSPAPLKDWWLFSFWEYDVWDDVEPFKYYPEIIQPIDKVDKVFREKYGLSIDWRSFKDFLTKVESTGISVNYVPLVGHNTIRATVMGRDYKRKASEKEVEEMKEYVREAVEAGAHGLSTGFDYEPGSYASTDEVVELAKVVSEYNGIYATHWRRTGVRKERVEFEPPEKIKGIIEAIEIGRRANVPVQISHIMSGYTIYPTPPRSLALAAIRATLDVIEEAASSGVDVYFDVIPNTDGGVFTIPYLASLLAPWVKDAGTRKAIAQLLKAKDYRREVKETIKAGKWWLINPKVDPYWAEKVIILDCSVEKYKGKSLGEIAGEEDVNPLDKLFDILVEDPETRIMTKIISDEVEVEEFIKHPRAIVCTDVFAYDKPWSMSKPPYFLPHPNTYGVFPRYIRRYALERKVLSLEEAIYKITGLSAKRFRLENRGLIKPGYYADIVIFDPNEISDMGDYIEPRRPPKGINYVLVNGKIVVKEGAHTGIRPGKIIRRKQ